jgi:hypothetical protein
MSLSTSSSDHASDGDWRRWLAILVGALATGALLFLALVVVIDPYSSGHFTPFTSVDITTFNRLYMNAGRVRDTRFDAAIFGTSTSILIDPAPIGQATGHRFVLLSIEGAYPPEHHYLIDRFDRLHRDKPAILVVVLDDLWCVPKIVNTGPIIPRWLYEGLLPDYLQKILSHEAAKASLLRVAIRLGIAEEAQRPDGYQGLAWIENPRRKQAMLTMSRPTDDVSPAAPFPALDDLGRLLRTVAPDSVVLLVFAPVYRNYLPVPGSAADIRLAACKSAARTVAAARPHSDVLDLRVDGDLVGNSDHFVDASHYDFVIAHEIEQSIAKQLLTMLPDAARRSP